MSLPLITAKNNQLNTDYAGERRVARKGVTDSGYSGAPGVRKYPDCQRELWISIIDSK